MTPEARKIITALRSNLKSKQFIEAMMVPRLLLWINYALAHDNTGLLSDEQKQEAQRVVNALGEAIIATANATFGPHQAGKSLELLKSVIDQTFNRYTEGNEHKSVGWMAIMVHHFAGILLDGGYLPVMQEGSPIAQAVDDALKFVTEDDIAMFDRYAAKAAKNAVDTLRNPKTYGLWAWVFENSPDTTAKAAAALVHTSGTKINWIRL